MLRLSPNRPRNVDWRRAAALLYGDWGTSKAYVIGLAFAAAQFSSLTIIVAVCVLTAVVGSRHPARLSSPRRKDVNFVLQSSLCGAKSARHDCSL